MPYLRLHVPELSIERKRIVAQQLIDITLRAFHLRPKDRYLISVEFVREPRAAYLGSTDGSQDCLLEVIGHNLTEAAKRAFIAEATSMLGEALPLRLKSRVARLVGIKPDAARQIGFEFGELNPAISEPFVVHPRAA